MPVNLFSDEFDEAMERPGYTRTDFWAAQRLGSVELGASVYTLPPGEATWPYHWHAGNEELLIVLAGRPTLRDPDGEHELRPGDTVLFRRGPEGAHKLVNRSDEPAKLLLASSMRLPDYVEYPDSDKVGTRGGRFLKSTAVDYWEGE
jgi:uncharacterized cupin superfamily protein